MDIDPIVLISLPVLLVVLLGGLVARGRSGQKPGGREVGQGGGTDVLERPAPGQTPVAADEELAAPHVDVGPDTLPEVVVPDTPAELVEPELMPLGERFKRRLSRTRNVLGASVADLFGRGITDEAWDGL
ncbi:MAG: hypothetical protein WD010_06360, partial [Nitriliruptor sp.]